MRPRGLGVPPGKAATSIVLRSSTTTSSRRPAPGTLVWAGRAEWHGGPSSAAPVRVPRGAWEGVATRCVTPRQTCPQPRGFRRNLRSKTRWFTGFCNSHQVSHFATFFIDARAEISVAESRVDCIASLPGARPASQPHHQAKQYQCSLTPSAPWVLLRPLPIETKVGGLGRAGARKN